MQKRRVGSPHNSIPSLAKPKTQIDIVESNGEIGFIQPANLVVYGATNRQASSRYGGERLYQYGSAAIAERIPIEQAMNVPGNSAHSKDDAGVLDTPIGVQELGANGADVRLHGV